LLQLLQLLERLPLLSVVFLGDREVASVVFFFFFPQVARAPWLFEAHVAGAPRRC
jgi:hypothetical protein